MAQATYVFSGKAIVITGGGGDIGLATAKRFASSGAAVALLDMNVDKLERGREALAEYENTVRTVVCDVTDENSVATAFKKILRDFGRVDYVLNNAGYQGVFAPTDRYPAADFRQVIEVNVMGVFNVLTAATQLMKIAGSGAIVNTASHAGVVGPPNMLAYSASKAAVIAMTETAAKDLAPFGVRVNAISPALIGPGYLWTRQVELQASANTQYFSTELATVERQMLDSVPLRRLGTLDEVSNAVAFLLSDEASYVTGFNLEITGGI